MSTLCGSKRLSMRTGTFETNSSSVHAIAIDTKDEPDVNWASLIYITHLDFGWECGKVTTPYEKLCYLWSAIPSCNQNRSEWRDYLMDALDLPNGIRFNMDPIDPYDWPYIDHGDDLIDFLHDLRGSRDLLRAFVFGNSAIYLGNDNARNENPLYTFPDLFKDPYNYRYFDGDGYVYIKGN